MTKIFLTGATGYVGGEILHTLAQSTIKAERLSSLVRDKTKVQQVQDAYPEGEVVLGDLDDVGLVRQEAEAADIVLHFAATGHAPSSKAIAEGLQARQKKQQKPTHWIQISGATLFAGEEISSGRFGYPSEAVYNDVKNQSKILSIIRNNAKRVVENTVLAQKPESVRTALIVGPLIYGPGRGPVGQRSIQAPEIAKATLQLGHGFKLNDGENIWSNIHVQDLSNLVSLLVEAAIEGKDGMWNEDGIYNVENGELSFKDLGAAIAKEAHKQGLIKADGDLVTIDAKKADLLSGHASILWGTNARTRSSNAQEKLGWTPSQPSLLETIPDLVQKEAESSR
ncbi:NAD(P)-binding protein [Pyrenochaeta sp. DS3sAY3a]|nr:NAD(P)-binding protein [Pyrenochaeta sp. DS3sAY3a]